MRMMRRLVLSVGVAVSLLATLTLASVGASGGFGLGAGRFTFTDTSASASAFNPLDHSSLNVFVDRSTFVFRQRPGGALQTGVMTILSIAQIIPNPTDPTLPPTFNSTCLVIPDSDFHVSTDLQSATLATVDQSTLCPFFLAPVTGPIIDQKGGGGGGGGSIQLPLSATVTWSGNGVLTTFVNQGSTHCLTFASISHNSGQQALSASVNGSISNLGSFSGNQQSGLFGVVAVNTSVQDVAGQGILPAPCGGKG